MLSLMSILTINAQEFGYDSKTEIGNGLYKVKSGQCYGIIDDEDKVVVSVEYQDILYRQGRALLTKKTYYMALLIHLEKSSHSNQNIRYIHNLDISTMVI